MATVILALIGAGAVGFMLVFFFALCRDTRQKPYSDAVTPIEREQHKAEVLHNVVVLPKRSTTHSTFKQSDRSARRAQTR
jgi:hypothetical protein